MRKPGWSGTLSSCALPRAGGGEPAPSEELSEARWIDPAELANLSTTPGLAEIVAAAFDRLAEVGDAGGHR